MGTLRLMAPDEVCIDEDCARCGAVAKEIENFDQWGQDLMTGNIYCPECVAVLDNNHKPVY